MRAACSSVVVTSHPRSLPALRAALLPPISARLAPCTTLGPPLLGLPPLPLGQVLIAELAPLLAVGGAFFGGVALLNASIKTSLKKDVASVEKSVDSLARDVRRVGVGVGIIICALLIIILAGQKLLLPSVAPFLR